MPFYLSGQLKIVASEDLGGLGNNESAPATCEVDWALPVWESLPWLLLGGVLLLERRSQRRNRWLVLALGLGFVILWILTRVLTFVPAEVVEVLLPVFQAWLFGFGMVWLLSARLTSSEYGRTFLKMLLVTGLSSALLLYGLIDVDGERVIPSFMALGMLWVASWAGLEASRRLCRIWFHVGTFIFSQMLVCLGALFIILTLLMVASNNSTMHWDILLTMASVSAGVETLLLAPFALILFLHPTQHPRLKELLHLP